MAKETNRETREQMAKALAAARAGRLQWLDDLVRQAGYSRSDEGISQSELVAGVPRLTRATLLSWESEGLPAVRKGTHKYYPALPTIAWIYERHVREGRPSRAGAGGELRDYETEDTKWRSKIRELTYQRLRKTMIDRSEAEELMVRMVLEAKAALLSLPGHLAPQLEGQDAAEIRKLLTRHLTWICGEMAKGRVQVPPEVVEGLRKLLRRKQKGAG